MRTVYITLSGGVVQNVQVPSGLCVVVRDFDVEGCPQEVTSQDEKGDHYIESLWTHEETS